MKYGFIGCGNMGGAIAKALANSTTDILVSDRSGKARVLAEQLDIRYGSADTVIRECDRIFLGVKPHMMKDVLMPLQPILAERKPLLITMAAGLEIRQIEAFAGCDLPVIRIMPNLPAAVGEGMTLVCADGVTADALDAFKTAFAASGQFADLPESQFDAGMAISGCAPAFAFMFADALAKGGVDAGLPEDVALALAEQTMRGSAALMQADPRSPEELTRAVCSPGGTTIEGVEALRAGNFDALVASAVRASYDKVKRM